MEIGEEKGRRREGGDGDDFVNIVEAAINQGKDKRGRRKGGKERGNGRRSDQVRIITTCQMFVKF